MISPQNFDPKAGTAGYDSTAAITAALAAVPTGGMLHLPAVEAGYLISNGFTITKPVNIVGEGSGSFFVGNVPGDLFHVVVPANVTWRGLRFENFTSAATVGGSVIHLDTTAPNANLAEVLVQGINAGSFALHGVFIDNVSTNTNGGVFDSWFEKNVFVASSPNGGCYWFLYAGDSLTIRGGIATGGGYGVVCAQVPGAGNLVIDGINITALGGIMISDAVKPIIQNFEMEFSGPMLTAAAMSLNNVDGGTIGPGQIQILPAASGSLAEAVYLANSQNVAIDGIRFASAIGGIAININPNCSGTRVGSNSSFSGFGYNVMGG